MALLPFFWKKMPLNYVISHNLVVHNPRNHVKYACTNLFLIHFLISSSISLIIFRLSPTPLLFVSPSLHLFCGFEFLGLHLSLVLGISHYSFHSFDWRHAFSSTIEANKEFVYNIESCALSFLSHDNEVFGKKGTRTHKERWKRDCKANSQIGQGHVFF